MGADVSKNIEAAWDENDLEKFRVLTTGKVKPAQLNKMGLLLRAAESKKHAAWVQELLGMGCNPDITDAEKNTPLHLAAKANNLQAVEYLLKRTKHYDLKNEDGDTPLHCAKANSTAMILIEAGANQTAKNAAGFPPQIPKLPPGSANNR